MYSGSDTLNVLPLWFIAGPWHGYLTSILIFAPEHDFFRIHFCIDYLSILKNAFLRFSAVILTQVLFGLTVRCSGLKRCLIQYSLIAAVHFICFILCLNENSKWSIKINENASGTSRSLSLKLTTHYLCLELRQWLYCSHRTCQSIKIIQKL